MMNQTLSQPVETGHQESAPSTDAPPSSARRAPGLSRRPLALVLAVGAVFPPLLGLDGLGSAVALGLLGALLAAAIVPDEGSSSGRLTVLEWLPATVLLVVLGLTALGLVASFTGTPLWQDHFAAQIVWTVLVLAALLGALRRPGRVQLAPSSSTLLLSAAPFALIFAVFAFQPFVVWARVVGAGTDFSRHAAMVLEATRTGTLDYSGNGYPRSVHTALSLVQSASGGTDYTSAWQSAEGLLLLLFAMIAVSSALLAWRVSSSINLNARRAPLIASGLAMVAMLLGPWASDMLPGGFITSFEAGAIVGAVALLCFDGRTSPSLVASLSQMGLVALMAHAWILLVPLVALPTLRMSLPLLRSGRVLPVVLTAGASALVAAPVAVASVSVVGVSAVATAGGTLLPEPGFAWMALLIASGVGVSLLRRSGLPLQSQALALFVVGLVATLAVLLPLSGSGEQGYYLTKTAWTPFGVLVALAVPTGIWVFLRSRRRAKIVMVVITTVAAVVLVPVATVGAIGWLRGANSLPPLVIPAIEQLEQRYAGAEDKPEVLIWGLRPYLNGDERSVRHSKLIDKISQGTTAFLGYPLADTSDKAGFLNQDPDVNCDYLQQNPDVVLVTGPYAEGPVRWLTDASPNCPAYAADPANWLSIDIDPAWFTDLEFDGAPYGQGYARYSNMEQDD